MAPKIRGNTVAKCPVRFQTRTSYPQRGGIWDIYNSNVPYVIATPFWNVTSTTSGAVLNGKTEPDGYYIPRPGEVYTNESSNQISFKYTGTGMVLYFGASYERFINNAWAKQDIVTMAEAYNIKYRINNALNWTTTKLTTFLLGSGSGNSGTAGITVDNRYLMVPYIKIKALPVGKFDFQLGIEGTCDLASWATGTRTIYKLPHTLTYRVSAYNEINIIELPNEYENGLLGFESYRPILFRLTPPGTVVVSSPDGSIGETLTGWELMPIGDRNLGRNPKNKIPTSVVLTPDGRLYVTKLAATKSIFYSVVVQPRVSGLYGLDFGAASFRITITT